jgi:DNA-binding transcriptional MerR regulator
MAETLPQKLYFRIGEVAGIVGVEPHVLRYWEREFRSIRPTKSAKGQRVYSRKDVENLLRVRDLLYRDGFTIAGAKKRLQRSQTSANAPSAQASLFPSAASAASADGASADAAVDTSVDLGAEASADVEAHADDAHADDEGDDERDSVDPMREKLAALRAEVEGFLHELESERAEI